MECIFCKIVRGEIPSYTIFEDDIVRAFLDVNPVSNGHTLIVPKKHFTDINDIDLDTLKHIQEIVKDLYPKYKERLNCEGISLVQNNEYGQEVKHYHLHMIPRYEDDDLAMKAKLKRLNPEKIYDKLK